jgi:RND family efflux transporter MFP subunit
MTIRRNTLLVFGAILFCLIVAVWQVKRVRAGSSSHGKAVGAAAGIGDNERIPFAAVALVKRADIANSLSVAGEFLPYQEIEIHAKVAGYIRKINVDIGDRVKQGQVLAVLEVPELVAELQGAGAGVRHSQQEVQRAQNEVSRAEADHAAVHSNALRLKQASTARPGLIAEQELDDAEAKDRATEAQIEAAKSALAGARQQLEVSQANNSQVSAMSDYTRITAPFAGVVTWRYADTGALVQAGTSNSNSAPVVKLAQVNVLRLRIPVPESLAAAVHVGEPANVTVKATGEHFTGKVTRFTDSLDRTTRTMQVEIDVPNEKYKLQPGMYADVVLDVQSHANVLTVPMQAVQHHDGKSTVLVVDQQDRVQPREIQTGLEDPNRVEVLAGLAEGERLIVANFDSFHAGQLVETKVVKFDQSTSEAGGAE